MEYQTGGKIIQSARGAGPGHKNGRQRCKNFAGASGYGAGNSRHKRKTCGIFLLKGCLACKQQSAVIEQLHAEHPRFLPRPLVKVILRKKQKN